MRLDFGKILNIYFLGIGGIGMSALARFAKSESKIVAGYDLTETPLTKQLSIEGITIHYREDINQIPATFLNSNTLVVRTPAVPENHLEYQFFIRNGYEIVKRSELLGFLTNDRKCIAVSGTHGKTSVSTMVTLLLMESGFDTGAFLGGISRNFNSNLVLAKNKNSLVVTEADEYDRSFLQLHPSLAVITSIDADHLDIYGDYDSVKEAFKMFVSNVSKGGIVLYKEGIDIKRESETDIKFYSYSIDKEADFTARRIRIKENAFHFDIIAPDLEIKDVILEYPGRVNVENILAAASVAILSGADPLSIKSAIAKYKGVQRRFDIRYKDENRVYIDDYAHHPEEIRATISSVKELYKGKKVLGVFQPHLYSRTKDFADGFAESLDLLDEVIILDIYPAREEPIPGVTSEIIYNKMKVLNKSIVSIESVVQLIRHKDFNVLLTMGAGSIDKLIEPICSMLKQWKG